jgi:hypothetical protein
LHRWQAESAGNRVDAVGSASLRSHQTHTVTWNYTDANGTPVPDGAYKVIVEVTDHNGAGETAEVAFTKGVGAAPVTAPDQPYYKGMQLLPK